MTSLSVSDAEAMPGAAQQPVCVCTYRSNSGEADLPPAHHGMARRSDASTLGSLPSSAPVFTGCSAARADARVARLSTRGQAPSLSPAVDERVGGADHGYFGSSSATFDRRAERYRDYAGSVVSRGGGAPVFSGSNGNAHERRMLRCVDSR
jgi:hypothetical protein